MSEDRTPMHSDPARARRQTAGLVAQYIHELSQRHADTRQSAVAEPHSQEIHDPEGD